MMWILSLSNTCRNIYSSQNVLLRIAAAPHSYTSDIYISYSKYGGHHMTEFLTK